MIDLQQLTNQVVEIANQVGSYIREERKTFSYQKVEIKGLNDLVSYIDKTSEEKLVTLLKPLIINAGFIVEEDTVVETNDYNWIVDPLDGTTNFIHGIPSYAISIGLEYKGEVLLGVVYEIAQNECFSAYKNGGAFLNGKSIKTSSRQTLSESLIATGFPINNFDRIEPYIKALTHFMRNTHGVRRIGAAAVDLCYLACGRVDAFFEYNLKPWDVAAGALIVKEAGGSVADFKAGENWLFGKEVMATNGLITKEFEKVIQMYIV